MRDKFKSSMKQKLMLYVFSALVFILLVTVSIFYTMNSYEREENVKEELKVYSYIVGQYIHSEDYYGLKSVIYKYEELGVKFSVLKDDVEIDIDSLINNEVSIDFQQKEKVPIIESSEKITASYEKNNGHVINYSVSLEDKVVIVASKALNNFKGFQEGLFYYGFAVIIIIAISLWVSNKVSYVIVKPIRDLDFITSMITSGQLNRRVKVNTRDELGQLGANFNHMADKLERSLNEISEKQNRLSAILQSMESGVIAVDNNRNIIMINSYAEKIFSIKSENIVGKSVEVLSQQVNFKDILSRENGDVQEINLTEPIFKDLKVRIGDIIINNHQHIGAVAVFQDITDMKKLENMRTEFVANVSHELKTPLTSIRGFAETLRFVEEEETKNKFLDIIEEEAERLTRLISDILLLSQIEQHQEIKEAEFNVDKVIDNVIYLMDNTAKNKQISLSVVGDDIDEVHGDVDRFKQMLINLVDNGIKYSEINGKVVVTKVKEKIGFKIIVSDNGIGISKEAIPRLFERFYRVDKARSRAKGGTGLGLAIVKHIVIGFNGTIEVESESGVGTKFIITIPYK